MASPCAYQQRLRTVLLENVINGTTSRVEHTWPTTKLKRDSSVAYSLPCLVQQVQRTFKAMAKFVSSGANLFVEGVTSMAGMADTSARVHMKESSDEPTSFRRIASSLRWSVSLRRPGDTAASATQSGSVRPPGSAPGTREGDRGESSETKLPMTDVLDEEVSSAVPKSSG